MNISNLFDHKKVVFSLEVFPPKTTSSIDTIYNTLFDLRKLPVDFMSVTYGAGGSDIQRDKTMEIASLIKSEYRIEPLAHLTCVSSGPEDISRRLDALKRNGVTNVLALRGDMPNGVAPHTDFPHASDLARFIKDYDSAFDIVGACYPERHCEADSLEQDIENLRYKIDNGVTHLISQLFFDNGAFYSFLDKAQSVGIDVPVEAGIMPITNKAQIERMVTMCGASLPNKLTKLINKYGASETAMRDAGIAFATEQIIDLIANNVRGIHLYTMNNTYVATKIYDNIAGIIKSL